MNVLCLTGWQQPSHALSMIAPKATHFDYSAYDSMDAAFAELPREPDIAIGWSLGAELLVHAVAGGYTNPGSMLLIGAPYQYIADEHFTPGVPADIFRQFRDSYSAKPEETLAQFHAYSGLGDKHAHRIIRTLGEGLELWPNGLFWLDTLGKISCRSLDFSAFPDTVLVHGVHDKIVHPASMEAFATRLPEAQTFLWPDAGHAPHLHNTEALRTIMEEYV